MAATVGDDDFDQLDKPGAERSRRRRTDDDNDWDSELEDDLLEEDFLPGKKNQSDLSDEELNDDLLQSDEEEEQVQQQNFSSKDATVSLNATTGLITSFDLSESANDQSVEPEYEQEEENVYEEEPEIYTQEYTGEQYEDNDAELTEDQIEYVDEQDEEIDNDEVLDLEINEPLDEFADEDYSHQAYSEQEVLQEQEEYVVEEELIDATDSQETSYKSEEMIIETGEVQEEIKEESDEEDDEDEESCRLRFKTERKEGTIIRLSDGTRERRNIPETLELSAEAKAALMEFEERERQRKQGRYGPRRGGGGGRRGRGGLMSHIMGDSRRNNVDRGRMQDYRPPIASHSTVQPIRSLFQQQHIQPLLPLPHSHHSAPQEMSTQPQAENPRMMMTPPPVNNQQPKNIHINPHFKGAVVTPVQVPLLPLPNQPRPAVGPQRFPGPPDFQQHAPGPMPGNFNQVQRLPLQDQWRNPPPPPEREHFFIGEPRFPSHIFDQRSPPPPLLLNSNHPPPNQNPLPFNQAGPGFNQPGQQQQPGFNPPGQPPNFNPLGQPPNFNPPGQPPNFNPPGQPPNFNPPGQQLPNFNPPGQQLPNFNPPGQQPPNFNQPGQQPGFPRDRPIRPNIQTHGPVGILHFNQPGSSNVRPFIPPRQQFPQGPGQPLMPLVQPNLQGPLHPPLQPQHQHHHLTGPPQPLLPISQPQFRPLLHPQPQPGSTRMQLPQRPGPVKPRHSTPVQNIVKRPNQQQQQPSLPRNSNLRELPIAPSHMMELNKKSQRLTPAAQVKPITSVVPPSRTTASVKNLQMRPQMKVRAVNPTSHLKVEVKTEPELPDEDEETRLYRLKIEEQKRLREEILKQKELRRQQQAGARKKELLERLAQRQQQPSLPLPPAQAQQEEQTSHIPTNGSSLPTQPGTIVRPNMKNRLHVQKQETVHTNVPRRNQPHFQTASGLCAQVQDQQKTIVKQLRPNRITPQTPTQQFQKMQTRSAVATTVQTPPQTARVASVQGRPQEIKPGAKRTVMQRASSAGGDGPHVGAKVRVIKLPAGGGENIGFPYSEGQPQRFQQSQQQRQMPVRKVTLSKGTVQQQQQQIQQAHIQSAAPQGVKESQGFRQPKQAIMRGRGRGVAGQIGRGRLMPNKQNLRVVECKPQPCIVSVEGLSSSTTDLQLKNLLMSVGPIQNLQMIPQQRKAIAQFIEPRHALAFQQKFHRSSKQLDTATTCEELSPSVHIPSSTSDPQMNRI
uniref:RNA-binding protein 33 isoform X2 n=1 Tax=Geotrypetes seraphini TaxID=260995 RepID=A0A6P8PUG8_GEOSA|nr:RNA-binding protein 33 isoform X2 [Geotrypetes seraphini]